MGAFEATREGGGTPQLPFATDASAGKKVERERGRVSVIVPAFNAASLLPQCLAALRSQSSDDVDFEVIVVDDVSTDETAAVAESLGARVLRAQQNSGPAHARNLGAWLATGDYLFFVDADVVVHPGTVARVRDFLDGNPSVSAVFGSYDDHPRARGTLTEYRNLLHHFVHQNGRREASTFWTGCGAVRRSVYLQLGGLDAATHPRCIEDIEFGYRLRETGHEIVLDRDLQCTHLKRWTLRSWIATDVFGRAIPWAQLILKRQFAPNDLNIKKNQKASVALIAASLAFLLLCGWSPWFLLAAAATKAAVVALNLTLFRFFHAARGLKFALACIPLHGIYFLYSGLSFLYVWLAFRLNLEVRDGNSLPLARTAAGASDWRCAAVTTGAGAWWTIAAERADSTTVRVSAETPR